MDAPPTWRTIQFVCFTTELFGQKVLHAHFKCPFISRELWGREQVEMRGGGKKQTKHLYGPAGETKAP